MADYKQLKSRLDAHEIILLDGAIGTQLQHMRAPMNNQAWAAAALDTHPFTVRRSVSYTHLTLPTIYSV